MAMPSATMATCRRVLKIKELWNAFVYGYTGIGRTIYKVKREVGLILAKVHQNSP